MCYLYILYFLQQHLLRQIFDFQLRNNPIYKDFVCHLKGPRYRPSSISQIPFLPISLFKTQTIASVPTNNEHSFFLSSGTTTKNRSKHIVHDMSFYLKNTRTGHTLCDLKHPIILEKIEIPDPVISISVEPSTKQDHDRDTQIQQ